MAKSVSWALSFKCFHNYKLFFSHVYQLHAQIYDLNFIMELIFLEIVKNLYFFKH
jgi:hypothetical protein